MANRWRIPAALEQQVRTRDLDCVYCRTAFTVPPASFGAAPSWEHIVNDAEIITPENIALCCRSCNSSKGAKLLHVWLDGPYCQRKGVTFDTVASVVRQALGLRG